ncbi:unnamed protein product [Cuscuta campestris]|uniref:TF-B3 domain-containing protein n=1 Tax=Cuscuta campestris TaxID=132261 RepID=A0A484MM23_9ASTE|nr:unnamed protein product [Cuscuta campestris]
MSPSSSHQQSKVCFNSNCRKVSDRQRKGWRRRTGDFADLCDPCASAYEEGKFCETFHPTSSGWRACESCGKKIHCGCIVSFHTFVLLDAGGIECITCARKSFILTPNPAWPPPSNFHPLQPEGNKDSRSWTPIAGSGPVPWRQAPSLFNGSVIQTELQPKTPYGDITGSKDRLQFTEKSPPSCLKTKEKVDSFGILLSKSLKSSVSGKLEKEISGFGFAGKPNPFASVTQRTNSSKNGFSSPSFQLTISSTAGNEGSDLSKVFETQTQPTKLSPPMGRQSWSHNCTDSSGEVQTCSGKLQGGVGAKPHLLCRYYPRIADHELQQISGNTNCVITPLFEKMLSASDASKVGRLVLPKKCAEAYFPPILHPEGLPLKVQDPRGKEWVFQFRFWPNNNSRVYVLEGFTACLQSMQLQAGDIVTFSRTEPEGKLVLGCRKYSCAPSMDQGHGTSNNNFGAKIVKLGEISTKCSAKFHFASPGVPVNNQAPSMDSRNKLSESNESNCISKEVLETKPPVPTKKQNNTLNPKSKRVRIDSEQSIELNLTVMEAQQLMRPSPNEAPTIIVIEGCDFEEYEHEAPIIGRPTIPCTGNLGEKFQWAQCEDCYKWRKIPCDALLPARWTCSQNIWDLYRSACSAVEDELTPECLAGFSPTNRKAKRKKASPKQDIKSPDTSTSTMAEALANLAIEEEEEDGEGGGVSASSSQGPTVKHPRHRPGCTCIVCIQPPSGTAPEHKQHCECNLCKSVRLHFKTAMPKKKGTDKLLGKEVGPAEADRDSLSSESCREQTPPSKGGGIDLNVKPDSPVNWHHELTAGNLTSVGPHHQVINLNGGGPLSCGDRDLQTFDTDLEVGEIVKFSLVHIEK